MIFILIVEVECTLALLFKPLALHNCTDQKVKFTIHIVPKSELPRGNPKLNGYSYSFLYSNILHLKT